MADSFFSGTDGVVLTDAGGAFLFFLFLHLVFFRFVRHENVPRWLKNFIAMTVVVNFASNFLRLKALGILSIVLCSGVSTGITILLIMIYTLGCFGLMESSIRMRVMWELYKVRPRPLSLPELMQDYNAETILKIRLGRLTATKEIIFDGKNYRPGNQMSFFVFKEWIGQMIMALRH